MSLSAKWNAILALSRGFRLFLKAMPWASARSALAKDEMESLLRMDPGALELLRKTKTSGEYPLRMLNVFFACVH